MNARLTGMKLFKFGKNDKYHIQLFYPRIVLLTTPIIELFVKFDNSFRIVKDNRSGKYLGIGVELFGFGIAFDKHETTL